MPLEPATAARSDSLQIVAVAALPLPARATFAAWQAVADEAYARAGGKPDWPKEYRPLLTPLMLSLRAAGFLENQQLTLEGIARLHDKTLPEARRWGLQRCPELCRAVSAGKHAQLCASSDPVTRAAFAIEAVTTELLQSPGQDGGAQELGERRLRAAVRHAFAELAVPYVPQPEPHPAGSSTAWTWCIGNDDADPTDRAQPHDQKDPFMPPEPDSTATVATPAIEPAPDDTKHPPLTLTHPIAPIHLSPDALPPVVRLRGPLITDNAWTALQKIDMAEARLRGELLGRAYDALLEDSDGICGCAMAELIAVAERLRPIATLDGRLDARAAGLLLECVPLSMSTAEREQAAIYLGLLPPAAPAPEAA